MPIFACSAYAGSRLWEKLYGQYLNYVDHDVAHDFKINYEARFKLYEKSTQKDTSFTLKNIRSSSQAYVQQGKNLDQASLISQIRNLENIVYVDEEDLNKVTSVLELQLLIDSVTPKPCTLTPDQKVKKFQKNLYSYKLAIENGKYMESEKERLLGLPFMIKRHQQYPEPGVGTWQYNLFEELFGVPYSQGKNEIENEEKIHKYNYKQFLHPSIIEKFNDDPDHPDFEMYIKMKNIETQTRLEFLKEQRKKFCIHILPELNLLRDEKLGREFAYYYLNNEDHTNALVQHFDKNYSNKDEEKLFRLAEESRLLNKNYSVVAEIQSSTIKDEYKGIRSKELREILNNPKKKAEVSKALKTKFKYYSPKSKYEILRSERNRAGLIDTAIEEGVDLNDPSQNSYKELYEKTYANPDNTELEDAALSKKNGLNEESNSFPLGHPGARFFRYDDKVSFEDYQQDIPEYGFASFKNMRYEYRTQEEQEKFRKEHTRKFGHPSFAEQEGFLVAHLERGNDEAEEKIFKRKPIESFEERKMLYSNEMTEISDFVDYKLSQDLSKQQEEVSEDDIDQAVFDAQHQKSLEETDEFKKLGKRNREEILALFKINNIVPDEFWEKKDSCKKRK